MGSLPLPENGVFLSDGLIEAVYGSCERGDAGAALGEEASPPSEDQYFTSCSSFNTTPLCRSCRAVLARLSEATRCFRIRAHEDMRLFWVGCVFFVLSRFLSITRLRI